MSYVELSELPDGQLACRLLHGHAWDRLTHYDLDSGYARHADAVLAIRCTRCHLERFDYLTKYGVRMGRYYRRPADWAQLHRTRPVDLAVEAMNRSLLISRFEAGSRRRRRAA